MAPICLELPPKPRYRNTVVCDSCFAEYSPSPYWKKVVYTGGTTDNCQILWSIPENECPVCRTPRKEGDK